MHGKVGLSWEDLHRMKPSIGAKIRRRVANRILCAKGLFDLGKRSSEIGYVPRGEYASARSITKQIENGLALGVTPGPIIGV